MTKYILVKTAVADDNISMKIIDSSYDKANISETLYRLVYKFMQTNLFEDIKIDKTSAIATVDPEDYENEYINIMWNIISVSDDSPVIGLILDCCFMDSMPIVYGIYDSVEDGISVLKNDKNLSIISEEKDSAFFVRNCGRNYLKFFEI